jgi:hypothetical protein
VDVPDGYHIIQDEYYTRLVGITNIVADLDRCPHGRHRGDVCGGETGCNGPSRGNPYLTPGGRVGTTIAGRAIKFPPIEGDRQSLTDPSLWLPE